MVAAKISWNVVSNSIVMKNVYVICLVIFSVHSMAAQQWITNLEDGFSNAKQSNRSVLLFFNVPDACDVCTSLEKRVFSSKAFLDFAVDRYSLVKLDFVQTPGSHTAQDQKSRNLIIVEKYNKDGFFPLVVIMDEYGNVAGKIGSYNQETPLEYIAMLQNLNKK